MSAAIHADFPNLMVSSFVADPGVFPGSPRLRAGAARRVACPATVLYYIRQSA